MTHILESIKQLTQTDSGQLVQQCPATQLVQWLLEVDVANPAMIDRIQSQLKSLARREQTLFWEHNQQVQETLQQLMLDTNTNSQVTQLLQELHQAVQDMMPPEKSFSLMRWFKLLFSWQQDVHQMWLDTWPRKKTEIRALIKQLGAKQQRLTRDNQILAADAKELNISIQKLNDAVSWLSQALNEASDHLNDRQHVAVHVLEEEFLPALQQRYMELRQQSVIAGQAMMTIELITQQNTQLMHDIEQTVMATTSLLDVTAGIAMARGREKSLSGTSSKGAIKELENSQRLIQITLSHLHDVAQNSSDVMDSLQHEKLK